jgi:hypothetical protein
MLENIEKYIKNVVSFRVENIFYFFIFLTKNHWEA